MECVFDTCLCGILYWAFGFAFQFGKGNGLIGHQYFLLQGMSAAYGSTQVSFLAFFLFQFAFADTGDDRPAPSAHRRQPCSHRAPGDA